MEYSRYQKSKKSLSTSKLNPKNTIVQFIEDARKSTKTLTRKVADKWWEKLGFSSVDWENKAVKWIKKDKIEEIVIASNSHSERAKDKRTTINTRTLTICINLK